MATPGITPSPAPLPAPSPGPTPGPEVKRKLELGPDPKPEPPKPPTLADVKLQDSLPGHVQRIIHAIKELLRWLWACLSRQEWKPAPLGPKIVVHEKIPRDIFTRLRSLEVNFSTLKDRLEKCFAPEQQTEIFRAIGRGDVEHGRNAFELKPARLFIYLSEVRWKAAHWGQVERIVHAVRDWVFPPKPQDLDPKHAEICLERFYASFDKGEPVEDLRKFLEDIHGLRTGIDLNAFRSATTNIEPYVTADPFNIFFEYESEEQAFERVPVEQKRAFADLFAPVAAPLLPESKRT